MGEVEILIPGVTRRKMLDPELGIEVEHVFEGWWRNYARWRSLATGRLIVGPPYRPYTREITE